MPFLRNVPSLTTQLFQNYSELKPDLQKKLNSKWRTRQFQLLLCNNYSNLGLLTHVSFLVHSYKWTLFFLSLLLELKGCAVKNTHRTTETGNSMCVGEVYHVQCSAVSALKGFLFRSVCQSLPKYTCSWHHSPCTPSDTREVKHSRTYRGTHSPYIYCTSLTCQWMFPHRTKRRKIAGSMRRPIRESTGNTDETLSTA